MPILDVTVVGACVEPDGAAQRVADAAGAALGAPLGTTWVRLRELATESYAESGGAPEGVQPVFVQLLRAELPEPAARAAVMRAVADAVAGALGRPRENVHVVAEAPGAGRVAFGGELGPGPTRARASSAARWEAIVGYSRAVRVGELVWVTGTTAFGASGEPTGAGDAYVQARQCIANVERALTSLGASLASVVRTRMFVTDITRDWEAIGRAHAEAFATIRPATSMVEVRRLIEPWMLLEIEADAHL